MDSKKIKNTIIIILIILLICTFLIVFILKKDKTNKNDKKSNETTYIETKKATMEKVKTFEEYVIVKNIINRYLVYNSMENTEALYSMLSKDYIESNNITKQNIMGKIKNVKKTNFVIDEINCQELNEYNAKYFVECSIYTNTDNGKNEGIKQRDYEKMSFQVILDKYNTTFSIIPEE